MRFGPNVCRLLAGLTLAAIPAPARAAEAAVAPGTKLDSLTVGAKTYTRVEVRSVNARTITITHSGGMASIHLRDLPAELQARFHYDPAAEAAAECDLQAAAPHLSPRPAVAPAESPTARLLRQFGKPATINPEIDLRPKFFQLELHVKNQGRRPSCAIFAVVSALEFQCAELTGRPQKLSEEYLSWATRQTVQRPPLAAPAADDATPAEPPDDADDGYSLGDVVNALRGYGIPLQASMPNTFGRALQSIAAPPAAVIAEAREHQRVFVHPIPGRDNATRINNLVHALNAGVPVVVGLDWPNFRAIRSGHLGGQKPVAGRGHAVTLVGYTAKGERLDEAVFFFKNSWGVDWGQGGYGTADYRYLHNHLGDAVFLEVQRAAGAE